MCLIKETWKTCSVEGAPEMWLGSPVLRFGVLNCQKKSDCYRVGYNGAKGAPGLVSHSQTFLTAEGLESMVAFIGQGPPMRPFDRHVKQPIAVNFVKRHISSAWKCRHNNRLV